MVAIYESDQMHLSRQAGGPGGTIHPIHAPLLEEDTTAIILLLHRSDDSISSHTFGNALFLLLNGHDHSMLKHWFVVLVRWNTYPFLHDNR